ncbi:major urinary protein 20-like [Callospermophilus lateralis]|uniref:major urinary protein 20-like n=1 Tax=Callospermophilus lateralis TaxID=76772 RepID=UPI00405493C2
MKLLLLSLGLILICAHTEGTRYGWKRKFDPRKTAVSRPEVKHSPNSPVATLTTSKARDLGGMGPSVSSSPVDSLSGQQLDLLLSLDTHFLSLLTMLHFGIPKQRHSVNFQRGCRRVLIPLLLLLSVGLTLICAHTEGTHDVVTSNFDPSKYSGEWYSIFLASDQKEKIEENGSMRVFVEYIHALKNSSLGFKFHIIINGVCAAIEFVCDKTEEDGVYSVEYDGHNTFKVLETDYDNYIIIYLKNKNNGNTFQLLEVYGRAPDVSSELKKKLVKLCEKYGIVKENILDLTTVDRCIQARG